jgi:hypothetical protein
MKKVVSTILLFLFSVIAFTQRVTVQQYISTYKEIAIQEMRRTGVPAAITLAQGILESESGNGELVKKSNNHFGIKCKQDWTGEKVYHDDDESGECFRKYDSAIQSYIDHSNFLKSRPHYASLFELEPTDYKSWAYGLKKAGYATNSKYPQLLIKAIEDNHLNDYTLIAMNDSSPNVDIVVESESNNKEQEIEIENEVTIHEVKKKDNLYAISLLYKTTVADLKKLNNLNSNDLYVGQKIIVSKK